MKKFFVSVFVVLTTILTISAQQNSLKPNLLIQEAKKNPKNPYLLSYLKFQKQGMMSIFPKKLNHTASWT